MTDITLPRATVEQALEALNGTEALLVSMGVTHPLIYGEVENAITALRAALAQHSPAALIDPRGSLGEPIV